VVCLFVKVFLLGIVVFFFLGGGGGGFLFFWGLCLLGFFLLVMGSAIGFGEV